MHAVALKSGLPIDDERSLVDVELPDPQPGPRDVLVEVRAVFTNSVAMVLPVSTALFNTAAARFMNPTVSAMALAETLPARSLSSMASVNRVNALAFGESFSA